MRHPRTVYLAGSALLCALFAYQPPELPLTFYDPIVTASVGRFITGVTAIALIALLRWPYLWLQNIAAVGAASFAAGIGLQAASTLNIAVVFLIVMFLLWAYGLVYFVTQPRQTTA